MPGFDWNGNGKRDAFDRFMDMKVMSEVSKKSNEASASTQKKTTSMNNINSQPRENQQSNGLVIFKSLLAIGLVVGAFVACLSGEMGKLGMGLLLIGAAIGGYFILK